MTTAWQPVRDASGKPVRVALGELAELLDARLDCEGSGDNSGQDTASELQIEGVLPLDSASDRHLSFVHAGAYLMRASASQAAAFLIPESLGADAVVAALGDRPRLVVQSSQLAVAQALEVFFRLPRPPAGIHETAVVGEGCEFGDDVAVGPYAVLGDGCRLGDRVVVEAHAVLGRGCVVGSDSWLHAQSVLYDGCVLGERVRVHSGAVLGAHGFGYATVAGVHHKIPQVGRTEVGDDVEVGALSSADRALAEATVVGAGTKIDNQVHLGHNVRTGKGCILCGQVGIAGSTVLGDYVVMAGGAGVADHRTIGDGAQVAAKAVALRDVAAGEVVGGSIPAQEMKSWHRITSLVLRLPELFKRLRRLERRLEPPTSEGDV